MIYLIKWPICYAAVMFAMCVDNLCWIPDSSEYNYIKANFKEITFLNRVWAFPINKEGWTYVWKNRILEVLKHPRDILPAIMTSAILGAVL